MLKASLAAIAIVFALALAACDDVGDDTGMPPPADQPAPPPQQ